MAKLVIIDDEAAILELMSKLCRAAGHTVFGYTTGMEGIAAIRQQQPDLVIVDLRIGDVNGLDLVSMCRDQFPNTAVIMVTGRIHYTKWTDQNGTDRYGCEIIAEQVDFLAKAKEATTDESKKRRSK